ncbi:MAG TPA: AI-2E family transporter [Mycobacteriales bacterium]|nr:AI-2E family transporter [Mycobacteriales bacterium]
MTGTGPAGDTGTVTGGADPGPPAQTAPVWPPMAYWVRATLVVVATLAVVMAARRVAHVLLLVVLAFVLAVGMDPPVRWLGRFRLRRGWAVAVIFTGLAAFLALFVVLLVPPLVREVRQFADAAPGYLADLQARQDWIGNAARHANVSAKAQQFITDLPGRIGDSFDTVIGLAGTVLGRVFDLFTVAILSIYFMLALPRLRRTVAGLTRPARRDQVDRLLQRSLEKIGGYVSGNLITSAVCGIATVAALLALQVPYAVPLGMWAGVADLIPQVGAYAGAIPAVLVGLARGPGYGLGVVLYFIAYQQFENYVLAPRVYRNSIDLSPAAVIVSSLIGGTLAGFAGALLALPVAATIKVVIADVLLANRANGPAAPAPDAPAAAPPAVDTPSRLAGPAGDS